MKFELNLIHKSKLRTIIALPSKLYSQNKLRSIIELQITPYLQKRNFEALLNLELNLVQKKYYKNMDYRKLFPRIYNDFLKPVVYCRKNKSKKVSPHFFSVLYTKTSTFQNPQLSLFENFKLVLYGVLKDY